MNDPLFSDAITATLVLYLISKCFISASFLIIYPYAGELYPTELRGVGIGTSAYIGGLGLIVIPFINYLVSISRYHLFVKFYRSIPFDIHHLSTSPRAMITDIL